MRVVAVLTNAVLLVAGVVLELRPRFSSDVWTGAALAALAIVNLGALRLVPTGPFTRELYRRLRRIGLIANAILLALAAVLFAGSLIDLRTTSLEFVGSLSLLAPPALTFLALLGRRSGADGPEAGQSALP
ncbi:MAG: hypothetical protein AB7O37_04475 [Vicinamibacteria bacterium]